MKQLFVVAWLVVLTAGQLAAQARAGQYAPADIQHGARLYAAQCAVCHGATGDTVAGVDLGNGRFKRAQTDGDLLGIIVAGVPGTAMPPFSFNPPELTAILAYLRNMRDVDVTRVPVGDAARGKALFEGRSDCARCHRVHGRGPRLAPDLSEIGATRTADALQRSILDPAGAIQPVNRTVRAVTRDGRTISGRRLNEDTYTVQLIDEQERLVSLDKGSLREYEVVRRASMPQYKDKLSDGELADLVAYLLSLKGL
jgi:putative heme-binding domain-containing protein